MFRTRTGISPAPDPAWLLLRGLKTLEVRVRRQTETAADLAEALGGITFLALLTRGAALDDAWVERTATLILKGIGA